MSYQFLEFERPIVEMRAMIEELRRSEGDVEFDISEEITRLEKKCASRTEAIFNKLTPWQIAQLARHPERPYTLDYIGQLFSDFQELRGDRTFADDPAIVGGLARFEGESVMVIGHQKGRDTQEKVRRNFGMPKPEGYRKAARLMRMAERFQLPLFTFIDTPGAYPGIDAEERGQSVAIAENLSLMSSLRVPIITTVIGEGGSGGALAIGIADRLLMLKYSTYAVISPEGCAAILWKDSQRADLAAQAMGITASKLLELGLIDEVIDEPLGGAHRDMQTMATSLRQALSGYYRELKVYATDRLLSNRRERLSQYGEYGGN